MNARDNNQAQSIHALSGAYASDALDDLERRRFEEHLAQCPDCQAEVDSFRETLGQLALASQTPPPPRVREQLLADITQVRPLPPALPERRYAAPARRRSRIRLLAAAAAVLAVVGVGAAIVQPWHRGTEQTQLSTADQVLQAADATRISAHLAGGARATLVRSVSKGKAVLVTHGMQQAPDGKVYELWLQDHSGTMRPAGLMSHGGDRTVLLEGNAAAAKAAGITVEPAGGSDEPTSAPIALFDFKSGKAT